MEEKIDFQKPENQFSLAGTRLFFINWISWFPLAEKNLHIKEYCFNKTENRFPPVGIENSFKKIFLLEGKLLPLTGTSKKSKKNGCQWQSFK